MKQSKIRFIVIIAAFATYSILSYQTTFAQQAVNPKANLFPAGTIMHGNISYAGDTLKRHLLDIYLPAGEKGKRPLVIWVHGGAWLMNDKYADMGYMKNTIRTLMDSGYALASIDYRYSTEAVFPAQIQDCNQAVEYLYSHANEYNFDNKRIALMGFSAGGHLASLLALSSNNAVESFYPQGKKSNFKIKAVVDFYGPSDLGMAAASSREQMDENQSPLKILLGASPLERPDLAKAASPVTYVDKNDPPFIIIQGEKDESVHYTQSVLLSNWLKLSAVHQELIIVPNAPHFGEMFDTEPIRKQVFAFLYERLKK